MPEPDVARSEDTLDTGGPQPPLVVAQGITYRDLQRAIFLTFALLLVGHMAGPLTTLLLFFLLVFILSAVLNPIVVFLERRRIPRIASAVLLALGFLGLIVVMGWLALPPLLDELGTFISRFGEKQARFTEWYGMFSSRYPALAAQIPPPDEIVKNVTPGFTRMLGMVGRYTVNAAAGVLSIFLLLVLVVYTVAHPTPLLVGLLAAVPDRHRTQTETALRRILEQLKNWAFGSLLLGVIVGLMTAAGLALIGWATGQRFPYILLFSVIAGVGELIPNIGPILSAIPPALVALTIDPILGLWVVLLFIIIQQAENNVIVPMVMGQSLNLHPISVTFMVLVMGVLFGLLGAVLAVPVTAIVKVCWQEFYLNPRQANPEALQQAADEIIVSASPVPQERTVLAPSVDTHGEGEEEHVEPPAPGESGESKAGGMG